MKPLQLRIKGLNSFIDEQQVDFSRLGENGLFGIFGPTGSGKSTILDAITLALYGKVPRSGGQLNGIVNTQSDSVNVAYDFSLGNGEQRRVFQVQRTLKRKLNKKSNSEGVSTKSASLYDITDEDNPRVLYEGQREVNAGVEGLIGLNAEDFTRSVVLPQGSFSEFLKMTGADRGQMLERIFALEDYGEKMTARIKKLKNQKYLNSVKLESLLSSYAGVTAANLVLLQEKLEQSRINIKQQQEIWQQIDDDCRKFSQVWDWQQELIQHQQAAADLRSQQQEMQKIEEKVEQAEKASQLKPLIDKLEKIQQQAEDKNTAYELLKKQAEQINEKLLSAQINWEHIRSQRDSSLPDYLEKIYQLERAVKLEENIELLEREYSELQEQNLQVKTVLDQEKSALDKKQEQVLAVNESIGECSRQLESLKISTQFREKLNQAYNDEKQYQRELDLQTEIDGLIKHLELSLQENASNLQGLEFSYQQVELRLKRLLEENQALADNCPGQPEQLLELQQKISIDQRNAADLENWTNELQDAGREMTDVREQIQSVQQQLSEANQALQHKQAGWQDSVHLLETARDQNLAAILAAKLSSGEACPVCGSHDHPAPAAVADTVVIESLEKEVLLGEYEYQQQQEKLRQLELALRDVQTKAGYKQELIGQLKAKIAGRNLSELQVLVKSQENGLAELNAELKSWEERLKENEIKLINCKDELAEKGLQMAAQKTAWQKDHETLAGKKLEREQIQQRLQTCHQRLQDAYMELELENAEEKYLQLQQNDRQAESWEKKLKKQQAELIALETEKKALQDTVNKLDVGRAESEASSRAKQQLLEQKRAELKNICGEVIPARELAAQQKALADLEEKYRHWNSEYEKNKKLQEESQQQLSALEGDLSSLTQVMEQQRLELEQELVQQGFSDRSEAAAGWLGHDDIKQLKTSLRDYQDKLKVNEANIKRLEQNLDGACISEEDWQQLQQKRQEVFEHLDGLKQQLTLQEASFTELETRLQERAELDRKKAALDQEYGLIEELENLFKGKKFVEFIAQTQLKYIAREASLRLKEITRGRYALELSAEGDFIMRDDFNGGVRRATHTLSGGETFLTSLALALALSSHIQLGRASLEFFFLDEGFGSLDAETLEIVIDSLENLHSEKLTVGVISHVEELKQRVPRRLIVTQAIPGISGSTVYIE